MKFFKRLGVSIVVMSCGIATAADLGKHGAVYKIEEKNALDAIYEKLKGMEKTGELEKKKKEAIDRSMHSAKNPKPVKGIMAATSKRVFIFDPSMTLSENIVTDEGQMIALAGTKVNPLDTITMSKSLVFFDGTSQEQVKAVEKLVEAYGKKITPILVNGTWLELTKKWKRQVYFDQDGYLTSRFGIKAVPAIVRQKGKALEVAETPVEELKP
ncbi:type-F conjugative transfer system protein TraW [Acinetobacter baumannii]|uniref:type-F conjugative transfer system protein TraW n=1 Tax=Acinetobacter TaxID=469 RepID=UPI00259F7E25|nr:type-F conjugative transfer system protein TraW [Acinetobacter variabilis]EKV2617717.1 type-F conjugative transfer system protein TraW [Acinetobacter baumannii]